MVKKYILEGFGLTAINAPNEFNKIKGLIPVKNSETNPYKGAISKVDESDQPLYFSDLGTPVWANIEFSGGSYVDQNGVTINFPTIKFETVLLTIDLPKVIIKTPIQGRNGTVKEYIADDDYQINIKGVIPGRNNQYPYDDVLTLRKMMGSPYPLKVRSRFLQMFDIDNIVISTVSLPQTEGGYGQQLFNINALSDTEVSLDIK